MSIYCPGEYCSRRDKCAKHVPDGIQQLEDWSTQGTFAAGRLSENGEFVNVIEGYYYCGDLSNGYPMFEEKE